MNKKLVNIREMIIKFYVSSHNKKKKSQWKLQENQK